MDVREATPTDGPAIESLASGDLDADRLVRDRRVIVAETEDRIAGFLAYDTWNATVHISALEGAPDVVEALLAEPRRFADREGLPIEIVVPEADADLRAAVEAAGFEPTGEGPRFEGGATRRFRHAEDEPGPE